MNPNASRPVRLLLINPRFSESFWSFRWAINEILPGKRAVNPPLGLATVAALSPDHWEVQIVDENIESIPLAPNVDIVGIGGMGVQHARQKELLEFYRRAGYYVVAGGAYASLCPEAFETSADTTIVGEAENIWKTFCADFENGTPSAWYRESGVIDLADSPVPRFDLIALDKYSTVSLQFSRGCPYRCEFCDIIVMFGRRPRSKTPEQIGRELDALRTRNVRNVFFVDDNLIGDKKRAKALLRYLKTYQRASGRPFSFGTEASVNLAQDPELLELFRDAGFAWVFLGIESPDSASLAEAGKVQNLRGDLMDSVRRIYAYGIDVLGGFIVGFDNDTIETFDQQHRFIVDVGIQAAMVGLLTALPRTPLYARLEREGRLRQGSAGVDNTKLRTNVVPKRMTYDAMVGAYALLYRRLTEDACIATRIRNKLRYLAAPNDTGTYGVWDQARILARLLIKGIAPGGAPRVFHFARSVPWLRPRRMQQAVLDWIAGLTMKDYVLRHLELPVEASRKRFERAMQALRQALDRYVQAGVAACTVCETVDAQRQLVVSLTGFVDRRFFGRIGRHLRDLLSHTPSTVVLQVRELHPRSTACFARLLARLERHGDRIRILLSEPLADRVYVDSSIFHLVVEPAMARSVVHASSGVAAD